MIKTRPALLLALLCAGFIGAAAAASFQTTALNIKETIWARLDSAGKLVACDGGFRRGEKVHLILRSVGPFQAGPDGRHWFDLDMNVAGPAGQTVLDQKNLLGEKGHVKLDDATAESPYGIFESAIGMEPGIYKMTLTIRDRIGGLQATVVQSFTLAPGLAYGDAVFARMDEQNKLNPVEAAVFQRGEAVHFVLINVGLFKKGSDGKHAFDIDMDVNNPDGQSVLSQKAMLGENGHIVLDNDIAGSPYVTFQSALTMPAGTYTLQMTVRDLIAETSVSVKKPFELK
jgi:hypothetical protein